ncbi:ROK family transcriptional regulator [Listeria ilorinensis]|uniref:ROK family transcriptional regulator n=1 Tax=Listeria ilorinensis TaxID=2867439 RepID=UPI001EF5C22D|nr:ROK family transcriptional regulator [Listeria ilorinensis]
MQYTDKYAIREQNERILLHTIIQNEPLSRADLAKKTGLNKGTVSEIVRVLLERQLINETGIGKSTEAGGRRPILLQFNQKAALTVTIDLGYNYLSSALMYLDGEIIHETYRENYRVDRKTILAEVERLFHDYQSLATQTHYGISSVAIAIHGTVLDQQILFTPYYDLTNLDMAEKLTDKLGIPVYLENEANLSAIAEFAQDRSKRDLVSISVHSGVGAGIIIDGQLHSGQNGYSGEIGHMILFPDGRPCPCGNHGCLEQYCSEKAVLEEFGRLKGIATPTIASLKVSFGTGDPETKALVNQTAKYLAIAINNVNNTFNPEIIYINSRLVDALPSMIPLIKENLASFLTASISIESSALAEKAILQGAGFIAAQRFLQLN